MTKIKRIIAVFLSIVLIVSLLCIGLHVSAVNQTIYPVNTDGLSYGSAMLASTPSQEPDLILAVGTNGKTGYVKYEDLYKDEPKTPEEAIEKQEQMLRAGNTEKMIPLYEKDGKTVIGEFRIGTSKAVNDIK